MKIGDRQGVKSEVAFRKMPSSTAERPVDVGKLLVCLIIDLLGSSSELIPILGEATDVLYAPIAAILLRELYGSNVAFGLEFVEEILPFTDIIPLATICWIVDTYFPESDIARILQIGSYGNHIRTQDRMGAIDVNEKESFSKSTEESTEQRRNTLR